MRSLAFLIMLALAGCASSTGTTATAPSYASAVGLIQADYPTVRAAALIYVNSPGSNASTDATINAAIAQSDPLVASLSASSPTATILLVLQDLSTLVLTPAGQASSVSSNTKSDIANALSVVSTAAQIAVTLAPLF